MGGLNSENSLPEKKSAPIQPGIKQIENKLLAELAQNKPSSLPSNEVQPAANKNGNLDEIERNAELDKHLLKARISPTEEIQEPPACLQVVENDAIIDVCTLGNFSLAIGKAKSRKTFLVTLLFSIVEGYQTKKFSGGLPLDKSAGIYFDTEQGRFHVHRLLKRICKLIGKPEPANIAVYSLRKYAPTDRLALIERAIYTASNLGFVVIDGIRDLVTSINDEEQATIIASRLLKWTEELNIHIMTVLHQNKADNNARGHLGAELTNKAETVLSITKQEDDKTISIAAAEYCRDKDFDVFAFTINIEGLPEIIEGQQPQTNSQEKKNIIQSIGDRNIYTLLSECFSKDSSIKYSDLKMRVKVTAASLFKKEFGINKSVEIITYSKSKGWVIQAKDLGPYTLGKFD
jgi:hypothetical protein